MATFVNICKNFVSKNPLDVSKPNKTWLKLALNTFDIVFQIIAVHCTHGFNRTGFMISSFFVESEDWSIEAAVVEFAKAR